MEAELIIGLCDRWHCLPSEVLQESAEVLRMLAILAEAQPENDG